MKFTGFLVFVAVVLSVFIWLQFSGVLFCLGGGAVLFCFLDFGGSCLFLFFEKELKVGWMGREEDLAGLEGGKG